MFDSYFDFICLGKYPSPNADVEEVIKFRFKTQNKNTYLVDVEKYKKNLYIIKYYLKKHRLSEHKYSLRTNENTAHKIFGTCLEIADFILKKDSLASFGYVGANDLSEEKENTQRYRIYKEISERFFSPYNFFHYQNDKNSLYLMLNKTNVEIDIEEILEVLTTNYEIIL